MPERRAKIIVHNHGVIAGEIHGDVCVGASPPSRPSSQGDRVEDRRRAPTTVSELLESLFDVDSLRVFLHSLPEYRGITLELPLPPASTATIMFEAGEILRRHGFLNRAFADALIARFPRREADIGRVSRDW